MSWRLSYFHYLCVPLILDLLMALIVTLAVMDLFGLPQYVFPAFDRLSDSLPTLNLSLNLPKSLSLLPNLDQELIFNCTSRNLPYSNISIPVLYLVAILI